MRYMKKIYSIRNNLLTEKLNMKLQQFVPGQI